MITSQDLNSVGQGRWWGHFWQKYFLQMHPPYPSGLHFRQYSVKTRHSKSPFVQNGIMFLQLSRYTFGFFELDHQTLIAKYSETSNRWPVLFPSLNLRREKKRIYWATESMLQRKERENWKVICVFFHLTFCKLYSQPLNIIVVFHCLKFIEGKKTCLLFDVSLYFVMRVWWSS